MTFSHIGIKPTTLARSGPHPRDELVRLGADRGGVEGGGGDVGVAEHRGDGRKRHAGGGVRHLWLIDPVDRALEAFELLDGQWLLVGPHAPSRVLGYRPDPCRNTR